MQKPSFNNLFVLFVAFLLITPFSAVQATDTPTPNTAVTLQPLNIPYSKGEITLEIGRAHV